MKRGDSSNLNLLPSQAKFQAERIKLETMLKKYMIVAAIFWAVLIVIVGVFYFGSRLILKVQTNKYNSLLSNFQKNNQELVVGQVIKYRAKVLGEVLADRYEYAAAFEKIKELFSNQVSLTKFEIDRSKNFSVEVKAINKEGVSYLEKLVEEANQGKVDKVNKMTIDRVTYSIIDNSWIIKMEVDLSD